MKHHKQQAGFTTVEVMITLAIAGLIILMVLLVIPALRRNQHNFIYKHYANLIAAQIEVYKNINNKYPHTNPEFCDFIKNYVAPKSTATACTNDATKNCSYADIGPVEFCFHDYTGDHAYAGPHGEISAEFGHWCNRPASTDGTTNPIVSSGDDTDGTKYVVWTRLEPQGYICVDNSPY